MIFVLYLYVFYLMSEKLKTPIFNFSLLIKYSLKWEWQTNFIFKRTLLTNIWNICDLTSYKKLAFKIGSGVD